MKNERNITTYRELANVLENEVWEEFLSNTSAEEMLINSGIVHYMVCFIDALEGYVIPCIEEDQEEDGGETDNLIFKFFNEGHTLWDLANEVFMLNLENSDPFGLYSYQGTFEVAIDAVRSFYKS